MKKQTSPPGARSEARLPSLAVERSLVKLGRDIDIARRKRRLTIMDICERANISAPLYQRIVAGHPKVSLGSVAMVLFALGVGTPLSALLDAAGDDIGLLFDESRLPKRIRKPRVQAL